MSAKIHIIWRSGGKEIKVLAQNYPVVTILGPRQSGKTTLARDLFPEKPYYNLEAPDTRELIEGDPRGFLNAHPKGAILDEIQRYPGFLSYIQTYVDESPTPSLYILTGSHQLDLTSQISQSLAGRTGLFHLYPLSIRELMRRDKKEKNVNSLMHRGGYPKLYVTNISPTKYYRDYVQTYLERDVRQMINLKDLRSFQLFLKLCAGRAGQILNINSLSSEVGVTFHTIKNWLSVLEASFIIKLLPPFYQNIGKRLIKSPKLYFCDTGLLCYLLDIKESEQLERDPLRGHIFENFVVMDFIKENTNFGLDHQFYFYRDSNMNEVDILYQNRGEMTAVEIKMSSTFHTQYIKGLKHVEKGGSLPQKNYIIYQGKEHISEAYGLLNCLDYYKTIF